MNLKPYQQTNLDALDRFLTCLDKYNGNSTKAFQEFWMTNNPPITPTEGEVVAPYRNNVKGAAHVCHKVPTGGGKTFIAAGALKYAMNHLNPMYKMVVWLVPSNTILEQTLRNLRDKGHHYRQRIDTDFQNKVEIFDKQQALTGNRFTLANVIENLCILVMSFDSFRTNNKEGRKVYQENGYLQSFTSLLGKSENEEIQLHSVLRALHPVVVVDESHNATSKLSEQMLNELEPSIVIDLTATPRENSNVICFTDALQLKKYNMVKLPVIVYNHSTKEQVIDSAITLQKRLEDAAKESFTGDNYIRPIVLFQAESNHQGAEDRKTFEKVKESLVKMGIPEERIRIKTAEIDELKGEDLMSPECPVRYIITINALKEGWDCPFAYILASLADKSSAVDVEQIVGRVLRMPNPNAPRNKSTILNLSYVLTASAKFQETLDNVVKGLNNAGFSGRDYRAVNMEVPENKPEKKDVGEPLRMVMETSNDDIVKKELFPESIDTTEEKPTETIEETVSEILENAERESQMIEETIEEIEKNNGVMIPHELTPVVKKGKIQNIFIESAKKVVLPIFYKKIEKTPDFQFSAFGDAGEIELKDSHLLKTFELSKQPVDINFNSAETAMWKVDIDNTTDEHKPQYEKVKGETLKYILGYIRKDVDMSEKIRFCAESVANVMGKMLPLSQKDIMTYIIRLFDGYSNEQLEDFMTHINEYTQTVKKYILKLEDEHKEKEFRKLLDMDEIVVKPTYKIPNDITLKTPSTRGISKMLHSKEESFNDYEAGIINEVANLDNVEWWTRNIEKRGFYINGFINHYPDFIIKTKKGKIVILETKGDHLDAEKKIRLGNMWAGKAGNDYRYCLVYNERNVDGAYTKSEFLEMMKNL